LLRSHPGFQLAMRDAARSLIPMYRGDRLMSDRARSVFAHLALLLYYRGTDKGEPGLTVGAMKDMCIQLRLCSRGRCEAMLALMQAAGFLVASPTHDRRLRPLAPTEKLFDLHRERWGSHFEAMRHVVPDAQSWLSALADPRFLKGLLLTLGERYVAGLRVLDSAPDLGPFAERNAGMMILFRLALGGPTDGPFPAAAPVNLSINALATTYSVSRKHVLTLLRDAEAQQLLARGGAANNEVIILPRGRNPLEMFFAALFVYFGECAEEAARGRTDLARPEPARIEIGR
jgi:hypothetical protein